MRITVIGESNIDIAVVRQPEAANGGCTPGSIAFHHGGVARNIAHNLCLLGHEVRLASVFGDDGFAVRLVEDCRQIGMDLSLSTQFKGRKSPLFLSFNDETGNMLSAVSDADINGSLDLDWLRPNMEGINHSDMVVADTLLTVEALAYLTDHCEVPLYVDTVSPGKAVRFAEAMRRSERRTVSALKCNLAEALALTGKTDPMEAARALNAIGIHNVYLTNGAEGVVYGYEGKAFFHPSLPVSVVNVTGAGDAFFSGIIHANAIGIHGEKVLPYGLKAARHNIKNEAPVNPTLRVSVFDD